MEDSDLKAQVQQVISSVGIAGKVIVESTPVPGVVRLLGEVVSEDERLRADEAARSTEGVLDVMDEITLVRRK